ncbi:MAG: UDP-N-acetylmuramoyl-tripeptide--D-alanyl-D-alanine ligase [bacterium]|nr:UDP-N-acetylmuramoyl-tripeptide--D-alanyl-D-alanine ligase [bacterium]
MKELHFTDLRSLTGVEVDPLDRENCSFTNVSIDSRTVKKGEIFFAIRGEKHDGHKFIPDVIRNKVTTLVVDNDFEPDSIAVTEENETITIVKVPDTSIALRELANIHRRKFDIPITGITGTNGKTTTKEMTSTLLSLKFEVVRSKGNFNNLYGLPLTLFNITGETETVLVEMGASIPGEIGRLCDIAEPDYGLITNIARGHIEFFKTKDEVLNTKSALIRSAALKGFINGDDPMLSSLKEDFPGLITFGFGKDNDLYASDIQIQKNGGYSFRLNDNIEIQLNVPGRMNVYNALAAASIAREMGLTDEDIRNGLGAFRSYDQRLEILNWKNVVIINDSYNANPDSMRAAVDILSEYPADGKKYALLGDMLELGETSNDEHKELGQYLKQKNVYGLITVGDHAQYISESGKNEGIKFTHHAENHLEAAEVLEDVLEENDALLVKGSRGSKMELSLDKLIRTD